MPQSRRMKPGVRSLVLITVVAVASVACQATASPSPSPAASPAASPQPTPGASQQGTAASPTPPAPSSDPAAIYAAIEDQVQQIRGLQAKDPVNPVVVDGEEIKQITEDGFRKDNPEDLVAANERLLKGLELLDEDASLEDLYIEMLGEQVAGLYSPDDKKMYVVSRSGALGPTEKTTFSHEFTHALQDQTFDLSSLDIAEVGEGDRGIARMSLVEGDATLLMSYWQLANLNQMELLQLIGESLNPEITGSLASLPPILQESLMFPYTGGLTFVQSLQARGGWDAVNAAYTNPPDSTEQILHPEKYVSGEKPVDVTLPADLATKLGDGWKVGLEDTFGEFQLKVWLDQAALAEGGVSAATAAEGWAGDRIALLDGPNGERAIALSTAWDTQQDADEFAEAANRVIGSMDGAGSVASSGDGTVMVSIAQDSQTVQAIEAALAG